MFRKKDSAKLADRSDSSDGFVQVNLNGQSGDHSDNIIQIEDVHKSYIMGKEAVPALRGVSLDVRRGEILCLMGPSGSGKTTMLNIIGGLDTPSRGHVIVDGEDIISLNEEKLADFDSARWASSFRTSTCSATSPRLRT